MEYLGFWIRNNRVRPLSYKLEAIKEINAPTKVCDIHSFVGIVNDLSDMWRKRAHTLAPLTKLCSMKVKFKWTDEDNDYFIAMKKIGGRDVPLYYPNFSERFIIHTEARKKKLGGVVSKNGKPITFYSRKLNPAQINYTTTEIELLNTVKTLKQFYTTLLGHLITVYMDRKNLTFDNFTTERVLHWRLMLEEYGPNNKYIKGPDNYAADSLSRLPLINSDVEEKEITNKHFC